MYRSNLALDLPLAIPLLWSDDNGIHRGIRWLQTNVIAVPVDAFESCLSAFDVADFVGSDKESITSWCKVP